MRPINPPESPQMQSNQRATLGRFYFWGLLCLLLSSLPVAAQPSGGPYGPIRQTYDLPTVDGTIYYVATDGKAEADGKSLAKATTIESAIARVKTGDAIVMRGGTYRTGGLQLNQGITIQPYKDEEPVLKGTRLATEWEQQENKIWVTTWEHLFPGKPDSWWRRHRHGSDTPQHRFNNDMVFADGRFLQSVGWEGELDENSYYIDHETKKVYLSFDPRKHEIEITAQNIGLLQTTEEVHGKKPDGIGPTIRGITFSQYAYRTIEVMGYYPNQLSKDTEHGKDIVGTTLEHCTLSFGARVGGHFIGDSLTIRHCKIADTSMEGIYIVASNDVLLEKNIFTRNNIEILNGYYPSAVKIFNQSYRVTCRDNLVIDQMNSVGIWYDVGNVDGVFINNRIENVSYNEAHRKPGDVWPNGAGFYFEISSGAICAGNVFINCDTGIHLRNAADVEMYNNTFVNSQVLIGRTERTATGDHFDWHPSTGPGIDERIGHVFKNNLMVGDASYDKPLVSVWQPEALCGIVTDQQLKAYDNNVYVHLSDSKTPLFYWSPLSETDCRSHLDTIADLRALHPQFSGNDVFLDDYSGPLFRSLELGNYQLHPDFTGSDAATRLPAEISDLLGSDDSANYVGAHP